MDDGGPAFSGDKIKAWYLPGSYSKFMIEEFAKVMKNSGNEVPIIVDDAKKEISAEKESHQSMSLRDYYAGQAMQGYLQMPNPEARENPDKCSEWAYSQADSMIARKRKTEKDSEGLSVSHRLPISNESHGDVEIGSTEARPE